MHDIKSFAVDQRLKIQSSAQPNFEVVLPDLPVTSASVYFMSICMFITCLDINKHV